MHSLARLSPSANLHLTDLPYRFSSWACEEPQNVAVWRSPAGELTAWAVLQTPFWTIDCAIHPDFEASLFPQVLAWAEGRARQAQGTDYARPAWFVNVFSSQMGRIAVLEAAGFACQADVGEDSWSKVWMEKPGPTPVPRHRLPQGFAIRPLAGEAEAAAYVELHQAVFQSKNMSLPWRLRTLQQPAHCSELDLVAVAPDGRLGAFCIGWLDGARGQIEPLGCHPDFRRYALGRLVLEECLQRLADLGAQTIGVETDSYRNTAFALYESIGFRVAKDVLVYRKDY